jgi:hypothetical protein
MYFVRGFVGVPKETGNVITPMPDGLDSFANEVIEGLCWFFQLLLLVTHFLKGQ